MIQLIGESITGKAETSGIYFIQNPENNKVYIGSAKNLSKRWSDHRRKLNSGTHANRYLLRAFNKLKSEFIFGVICFCDKSDLLKLEQFYCDLYLSYKPVNGYNIRTEVSSNLGYIVDKKTRQKISKSMKGRTQTKEHAKRQCEARRGRKNTTENIELQSKMKSRFTDLQLSLILEDIGNGMMASEIKSKHTITDKTLYKLKNKTGYKYYFNGIDRNKAQATREAECNN